VKKNKKNHIIFFDGVCNLCNGTVLFILRRDKAALFSFVSLQSKTAKDLLLTYGHSNTTITSILYLENEIVYHKSDAALHISKHLSGVWKYLYYLIFMPKKIRDTLYMYIANRRYQWFGKKEYCAMPVDDFQHRFL